MKRVIELQVDKDAYSDVYNIANGVFHPLVGFMDSADYKSVVENMRLHSGYPWTIPITLDVPQGKVSEFIKAHKAILRDESGKVFAELLVEDIYKADFDNDIKKVFGTDDTNHPGVAKELTRSLYRAGGPVNLLAPEVNTFSKYILLPAQTKRIFKEKGWKTITGFQTRNPIHKAHEHLQRAAMEITDGLFIHPLIGWKQKSDFSSLAIVKSYEMMIDEFYPKDKTLLGFLTTPMRYAGPREAVFHALIRKNYGCTHFVVGRDHAGVGGYYETYEAHRLCGGLDDLGIEILKMKGPYYCTRCKDVVTDQTCTHGEDYALTISGTYIRSQFLMGKKPAEEFMRREIAQMLMSLYKDNKLFCKEDGCDEI